MVEHGNNWRMFIDDGIDQELPQNRDERELEEQARLEKSVALEQIFRSRLSVLLGSLER